MIASASPQGQDALLFFGLRTILKARSLHPNLRERANSETREAERCTA
jgi:hypothetical protein